MPFIATMKRPGDVTDALDKVDLIAERNGVSRSLARRIAVERASAVQIVTSVVAVATLEERVVFDSKEWVAAGGDQPDGNGRFYHHALVLSRDEGSELLADGSREQLLTVLFLHDGRRSAGHFEHMTEPATDRLVPETGGTIAITDGTIKIDSISWDALTSLLWGAIGLQAFNKTNADVLAAFNARMAA